MKIPILNGIYTDKIPDLRVSYPRNLIPVPEFNGINNGYLRPSDGILTVRAGPGVDRAGINWNNEHYRVMGSKLIKISKNGVITTIGDVGNDNKYSTLDYSFDYLGVSSNGDLFLYDGSSSLTQVTDPNLGTVLDHIWIDGYFMATDGEFVVVTELADPFTVLATKYGSSEADPDPILALLKVHNEAYVLNRYTVEIFEDIGGSGFPFRIVEGAQIQHGVIGTHACCVFLDTIVMVGSGRNEAPSIWLVQAGNSINISTREIDIILRQYSEDELALILCESRVDKGHQFVYIHLPGKTLVYDANASKLFGTPVWFILSSYSSGDNVYRARNITYVHGDYWVGDTDSANFGKLTDVVRTHWGENVGWDFGTTIIYNEGDGAIFHELELITLAHDSSPDSTISTQYSDDGKTWSDPITITTATPSGRNKNLTWLGQGSMGNWRIQRFYGSSEARLSFIRLEARLEGLSV